MKDISIVACSSYDSAEVRSALLSLLAPIGGLDWVKKGMRIAIKANLVSMMKPESAATTHPSLLVELVKLIKEKGADAVIGDSPGGLYNAAFVGRIYHVTGMTQAQAVGAELNQDYSVKETVHPSGLVLQDFTYTAYLDRADAIIDFCKLKTHGMMGMSAAAKNMFGVVPGTFKPEYHFRFPDHSDFAKMILDLNSYFSEKTKLCIVDAVVGMEGNGPTQGTPRKIGALLASACPHSLDLACARLIGLDAKDIPTLEEAQKAGYIPESADQLTVHGGSLSDFSVADFQNIHVRKSLKFEGHGKFAALFVRSALQSKPVPKKKECIGCKKCAEICPAKAITMKNNLPVIDTSKCITCFCCQEFCPKGAMKVHRPLIARVLNKRK